MDATNTNPLASAEKRRREVIAEIIAECEDPVTEEDIDDDLKEIIIPKVLDEFWDKGLNNSVTPRFWLWSLDYNLYVHFLNEGYSPEFDRKWPMEIGPEGESVPEYEAFVQKKLAEYEYLWKPQPAPKTDGNKVESPKSKGSKGEPTTSQTEAKESAVKH
ncbi:hypothetical protein QBC45DRAFT_364333 [Copromyces sp. CBS 386.78]|nr:hypothetical protein QBC45DRAFT_364333 [Copromyces sp. CBS 386.78]